MRDVGMVQRGQDFGFTLKASQAVRMLRKRCGQDFDGDFAVQLGIPRAVDFAL